MTTLLQNFIHYLDQPVSERTSLKKTQSGAGVVWSPAMKKRVRSQSKCVLKLLVKLQLPITPTLQAETELSRDDRHD